VSLLEDWSIVVPNAVIDTCNKESTDTDTDTESTTSDEHLKLNCSLCCDLQELLTAKSYKLNSFFDEEK
jgi:hypothetical protein